MFILDKGWRCSACGGEASYLVNGPRPKMETRWSCSKCFDIVKASLRGEASLLDKAVAVDQAEQIIRASWLRNRDGLPSE